MREDGSVLIQHRDNMPTTASSNTFAICGGKKEKTDRSLKHAAARELLEETGYVAGIKDLIPLCSDEFNTPTGKVIRNFFWTAYDETQPIKCFEGQSIKFYDVKLISELEFCDPYHKDYLEKASRQMHSPGRRK